jgi:hypothetical protein
VLIISQFHVAPPAPIISATVIRYYAIQNLGWGLDEPPKKSLFEKYLALKILVIIVSWSVKNFHPCFPSIAKLKQ